MIESLKRIFAEIKRVWEGLPPNRKVVISAVSTATLVGLIALLLWARHITYVVLYSNLDPQEAALVVERLKKDKIPYGLSKGGTTILVPSRDVYDIRLQLAGEGIPRTGAIGYEIFDKTNLGLTDFLQRVNYRRA
ncbi:MAG TPA: flagellar M-ring protein FliF, partial [Candidatus Latescibacteria bacterium]|nr:flagellar M-ring protein FliF [Candidatus Latescibacterota bacterium]